MEAVVLTLPVWSAVEAGSLDHNDEEAIQGALGHLPETPTPEQVKELGGMLLDGLQRWDQLDQRAQEHLLALAVTNLGCARQFGEPQILLITIYTAAVAMRRCFKAQRKIEDIDASVELYREDLDEYVPAGPLRALFLNDLAVALTHRYELTHQLADLNGRIEALTEAVPLAPNEEARVNYVHDLALGLGDRYKVTGDRTDLDGSIGLLEQALTFSNGRSERAWLLNSLSSVIGIQHETTGDMAGLERRIRLCEEALELAQMDPRRPAYLNGLSDALADRFAWLGEPSDLDRRIGLLEEALAQETVDENRAICMHNLGNALGDRFDLLGDPADLNRRVDLAEAAVELIPPGPGRPLYLSGLGHALEQRYVLAGGLTDLEGSIHHSRQALAMNPADSDRPDLLSKLALSLMHRFDRTGDKKDLDEAVALLEEALGRNPTGSLRAQLLNNFGVALARRYVLSGNPADLDERVQRLTEAVEMAPGGLDRPGRLSNLATALRDRYHLRKHPVDLEEGIGLLRQAVGLTPSGSRRPMLLSNLAAALDDRFNVSEDEADLNQQVRYLEEAVRLVQSGPRLPMLLSNLVGARLKSLTFHDSPANLNECIRLAEQAISLTAQGPARASRLNNLAVALGMRYEQQGNRNDLEHRVRLLTAALTIAGASERPGLGSSLGTELLRLADLSSDVVTAYGYLVEAAEALDTAASALEQVLLIADEQDEGYLLHRHHFLYAQLVSCEMRLHDMAIAAGRREEGDVHARKAYAAAERGKGRRIAALLSARLARPLEESVAALLPEIERLRSELAHLYRVLDQHQRSDDDAPRGAALPPGVRRLVEWQAEESWRQLRTLLDKVVTDDPNYASVRGFVEPHTAEQVAETLPLGAALVLLYALADQTAIFVVRSTDAVEQATAPVLGTCSIALTQAEILDIAKKIAASETGNSHVRSGIMDREMATIGRLLHAALQPHVPPPNADDPPSLILVPTGSLHRLPLHAMPWPDRASRLLDGYAVSFATSADVVALAQRKPAAPHGGAALAPDLTLAGSEAGLPGAIVEATAMAAATGGQALLRRRANAGP